MKKFNRMRQIFNLLDGKALTVKEVENQIGDISTRASESLLRHYYKEGYLIRKRPIKMMVTSFSPVN